MRQGEYTRQRRRAKRGRRILATVAFVLTVSSVAAAICLSMFFNVEEILVTGSLRYSTEQLVELSGIVKGGNIFGFDSGGAARAIYNSCPYIESVRVRRLLPSTVELVIIETVPTLSIVNAAGHYTLLGSNSRVLEQVEDVSTEGLPLIVGADFSQLPPGSTATQKELDLLTKRHKANASLVESGAMTDEAHAEEQQLIETLHLCIGRLETAQRLIESARAAEISDVSYYDVGGELSVSMLCADRVLLELGSELELDYKLRFAKRVMDELGDRFTGVVDLTTTGSNQKVYTREREIASLIDKSYREGYY